MLTQSQLIDKYFCNYLYVLWKFLGLPKPTRIQYEIAEYLQYGPHFKMIQGFRGVAKSYITSAYVTWILRQDQDYKFTVVSASKSKADEFSAFTKRIINEFDLLKHLRGGLRDSLVAFDVAGAKPSQSPSVKSVGIFGQLTGSRANEVIADDIEIPSNSATQQMREKLKNATGEFSNLILPGGKITYLGTPQSEESVYNSLPERGFDIRIWPIRYPSLEKLNVYKGYLAPSILEKVQTDPSCIGKPTEPTRFDELELVKKEADQGRSMFLLQNMLDTSLSDAEKYPLKLSDLITMPLNTEKAPISVTYASSPEYVIQDLPNIGFTGDRWYRPMHFDQEWIPYEGSLMYIDPSGRGSNETAFVVLKQLHGYLFLTDLGGFKDGYSEATLIQLAKKAKENNVNLVLIEPNFGDGMFTALFKPILNRYHQCRCEEDERASIQKERRIIDTLEPLLNKHRLIVDLGVVRRDLNEALKEGKDNLLYSLFYQLTHITKDRGSLKEDDKLDALAGACRYWVNSMSRDEQEAAEAYRERVLEDELRNFIDHALGRNKYEPRRLSWM